MRMRRIRVCLLLRVPLVQAKDSSLTSNNPIRNGFRRAGNSQGGLRQRRASCNSRQAAASCRQKSTSGNASHRVATSGQLASGTQGLRDSGAQGLRDSGTQGLRGSGAQGLRGSGAQGLTGIRDEWGRISGVHILECQVFMRAPVSCTISRGTTRLSGAQPGDLVDCQLARSQFSFQCSAQCLLLSVCCSVSAAQPDRWRVGTKVAVKSESKFSLCVASRQYRQ